MKRKIYLSVLIFGIASLYSCGKNELNYSCDKEINFWVKGNISNITKMTSDEVLSYRNDVTRQKAIYAALSPEQKKDLWKAKVENVLSLSWTEQEKAHIASLLKIIDASPFLFDSSIQDQYEDEIDIISYKWVSFAQEELGWYREIYAIAMTFNPITRLNDQLIVDESLINAIELTKTRSESLACSCHASSGITTGVCPSGFSCVTGGCDKVRNCGFLGANECIGLCVKD